jgi:hypothetical protein
MASINEVINDEVMTAAINGRPVVSLPPGNFSLSFSLYK